MANPFSRDREKLQHDVVRTLELNGPLTRRNLIDALRSNRTQMDEVLITLQAEQLVERYEALSARGRMHTYWTKRGAPSPRTRAHSTLAAFQAAARAAQC